MRYFVYALIDPRNGSIFYIGKGCNNRPANHKHEAKTGKQSRKCQMIREILDAGLDYQVNKIKWFADEQAAYAYEQETIAKIGLANLTNIAPGGLIPYRIDPDEQMVKALASLARKTNGLRDYPIIRIGNERAMLGQAFLSAMQDHVCALIKKRGWDWCNSQFTLYGSTLAPI